MRPPASEGRFFPESTDRSWCVCLLSTEMMQTDPPHWLQSSQTADRAGKQAQRFGSANASRPRSCVETVNSPIFLPMSLPTSVEKR